jgi:hypothetical protein
VRETPGFDGQDQRRADASGRSRFGPKVTIGFLELGMRRNDAALPASLGAVPVDHTMRHDAQLNTESVRRTVTIVLFVSAGLVVSAGASA